MTDLTTAAAHPPSSETKLSLIEGAKVASSYILRRQMLAAGEDLIWLAHDEVLGKDVTLHFVPAALRSDPRALDTLRQEIKRYRQLIHPQILRVYDLVEDRDCAAIVMDAFTGTPLSVLLAKARGAKFDPAELRPWLAMLCRTLDDAHKIKLVHRDLSPVNIIVDDAGKVLVAKFGISRFIRDAMERSGDADTRGIVYASPQQLDGETPAVADDVYGFGVLLFELLTGETPFAGNGLVAQIRNKVPSSTNVRRVQLKKTGVPVPAAWEKTIAACLEKAPERRPADMREIAARLNLDPAFANAPSTPPTLSRTPLSRNGGEAASSQLAPKKLTETKLFARNDAATGADSTNASAGPDAGAKSKLASKFVKSDLDAAAVAARSEQKPVAPRKESVSLIKPAAPPSLTKKEELAPRPPEAAPLPKDYPGFELRRGSSFPLTTLAAGAILIMSAVYGLFILGPSTLESSPARHPGAADESLPGVFVPIDSPSAGGPDVVNSNDSSAEPIRAGNTTPIVAAAVAEEKAPGQEDAAFAKTERIPDASLATAKTTEGSSARAADAPRAPATSPESPAAQSTKPQTPSIDPTVAAKSAALEKAQKEAESAEKTRQQMLKAKEEADAKMAEAQKTLEEKTKAAAPTLKAAEDATALQKKREEEMRAAAAAAQQAQQVAAEKARAAEEARKTFATVEKETVEKTALQQKAEAEIKELQTGVEEKRRTAADVAKAATDAAAHQEELAAIVTRTAQELAAAKVAAQKAAEEAARIAAEKRRKIEKEIAEAKAMFERKIAELESALKSTETALPPPVSSASAPEAGRPAAPPPSQPESSAAPSEPPVPGAAAISAPKKSAETLLALKTEPGKGRPADDRSTAPEPMENSLGMKFVPVGDILFCVWQTRVKDFDTFARATGLKSKIWRDPGFRQGPDHPVVNVTWREAVAFCKWLTAKEQKEGTLAPAQEYRLPSDLEWSKAVGLPEESGKTPEARDMGIPDLYPWGTAWPPPAGAGNYTGEETGSDVAIKGYEDGFAWTAPVGSFEPNKFGLYDMGGNVWQWCMDTWNTEHKDKVLRGGSWYNGALRLSLLSSCRLHAAPDSSTDNYGFRCVLAPVEAGRSAKK